MEKVDIEKLKKIELDILAKVSEVCTVLNIEYFLMGGTLLGAVRHQGFIPWDDDIDIIMKREDYDKFLKEAATLLPSYYFIQTGKTDPCYLNNFAKVRDSRTTFWETSAKKFNINHGVYIDIFPLDLYPEHNIQFFKKLKTLVDYRINSWYNTRKSPSTINEQICSIIGRMIMPNKKTAKYLRDKLYKSVKSSSYVANLGGAWGEKEIFPIDYFEESIKVPFESLTCSIPLKYDLILRQMYGDYMQLPPKEKRVGHHYTEVVDLNKSYIEYTSQFLS